MQSDNLVLITAQSAGGSATSLTHLAESVHFLIKHINNRLIIGLSIEEQSKEVCEALKFIKHYDKTARCKIKKYEGVLKNNDITETERGLYLELIQTLRTMITVEGQL